MVLGDARGRLHDHPIARHQPRQTSVEDGLDLIAEAVTGGAHAVGPDLDIGGESHDEVVGPGPLAHQRLHVEAVLAPARPQVIGEVVHDATVGDKALGLARELQLTSDL